MMVLWPETEKPTDWRPAADAQRWDCFFKAWWHVERDAAVMEAAVQSARRLAADVNDSPVPENDEAVARDESWQTADRNPFLLRLWFQHESHLAEKKKKKKTPVCYPTADGWNDGSRSKTVRVSDETSQLAVLFQVALLH